jgi:hypothetical protein
MLGAGFNFTQLQRAQIDVSYGCRSSHTKDRENGSALLKHHVSEASSSNVERFLDSVTPSVPAHYLSKVCFYMSSQYLFLKRQKLSANWCEIYV